MFKTLKRLNNLDDVSKFRLQNSFFVAIGIALLSPILVTLKGTFIAVWAISLLTILSTLSVKTNDYMTKKFSIPQLFKMGIFLHISFVLGAGIYFISPEIMIWLDSILVIAETTIFSAYSILLNNYITDYYPESMQEFQILRNSTWADGFLLGLFLITIVTFFYPLGTSILFFIFFNSLFCSWMLYNWNFFDKIEKIK